jgi:hypothetical protein
MPSPVFQHDVAAALVLRVPSTITITVPTQRDHVDLRVGNCNEFTVGVAAGDLAQLMVALVEGETSYIACTHAARGRVLLNVRPIDDSPWGEFSDKLEGSPRELSLDLAELGTSQVLLDARQAVELVVHLDAAWRLLDRPLSD